PNRNGGMLAFNPLAGPNSPDYGLLYLGVADGGSGGDPMNQAQNLGIAFGKIFRIDPLGNNSPNKKYGIPADNPMRNKPGALPEIFAYDVRLRHRTERRGGNQPRDIGCESGMERVGGQLPVPRHPGGRAGGRSARRR